MWISYEDEQKNPVVSQIIEKCEIMDNKVKNSNKKIGKKKELTKCQKFKSKAVHFLKDSRFSGIPLALGKLWFLILKFFFMQLLSNKYLM